MHNVEAHVDINVGAVITWRTAGDAGNIADWVPGLTISHLDGDVRHIEFESGGSAIERILRYDDEAQYYTFEFRQPSVHIESTLTVDGDNEASTVRWTATVNTANPGDEKQIADDIARLYHSALQRLRDRVELGARTAHPLQSPAPCCGARRRPD
ncbi:SRPBCC family protein [Nocardia sp. NPDC051570]|uniref:SRPBCC family protein n=1 Tax=Nocardia sp. NPDC051570 TaxID=3364324 RepID=UPI0037B1BDEE